MMLASVAKRDMFGPGGELSAFAKDEAADDEDLDDSVSMHDDAEDDAASAEEDEANRRAIAAADAEELVGE